MENSRKMIPVTWSSMPTYEEYCEEIKDLFKTRWLSNRGSKHKLFEKELEIYLKAKNIALFANGHVALEVAIDAFDLDGEVITTPYTHVSTTHCIVRNGLTPVFCDISEKDCNINAEQIENHINEKTVAIVATHVYGYVCDVHEIERIAKKHNLKVFYDAAHAFGVTFDGRGIATFGDASMFSTHATKVLQSIEGGIVRFRDDSILGKISALTNFGHVGPEIINYVGTNARMNEFEAAMGICNLRHIDGQIAQRKKSAERYFEHLHNVPGIKLLKEQKGVTHNYSYFPVIFDGYKLTRDEIQGKLQKENIYARKYFYPLTKDAGCYKDKYGSQRTPVATYVSDRVLSLPLYADLTVVDVDRICKNILSDS